MKAFPILILFLYFTLSALGQTKVDSIQRIQKMILGTWIDVESPAHILVISPDSLRTGVDCWKYKIEIEKPRNKLKPGQYWFGFSFHHCNEQFMQYFGNISIDNIYLKYHDSTMDTSAINSETFVFKRKQQ